MALRDRRQEVMGRLGLHDMKVTLDEIVAAGLKSRATPEKITLDLLGLEEAERKFFE